MSKNLQNLDGASVQAGITIHTSGAIGITGDGISYLQLLSLKQALELQAHGMKFSRHLPAATTIARRMLGIRGNRESLLAQVKAILGRVDRERALAKGANHGN